MCTADVSLAGVNVKNVTAFFDKVAFRSATKPNKAERATLRDNAQSLDVRPGHPIRGRGSDKQFTITLVVPTDKALAIADECGWTPNCFEAAIDIGVNEWEDAWTLRDFLDASFIQPWHGKQRLIRVSHLGEHDPCATTYTGQRWANLLFAWYPRLSKVTDKPCLHVEARYRGTRACRRAGVYTTTDLIEFDHLAHWERYLACYRIDFDRLGRSHLNKLEGTRRQKPRVVQSRNGFTYHVDGRTGGILFRALAAHEHQQMRSVQRFVDQYGRGPFLRRVDVSGLLSSLFIYGVGSLKLNSPLINQAKIPLQHVNPNLFRDQREPSDFRPHGEQEL